MDTLSDLISVVNKKRLSKIDVLDKTFLNSKSDNLYFKLYNAIETKKIKTDDEAARLVYNSNKSDPRYKMLKSRLKDKVLKSVMLLDADDVSNNEVGIAYFECLTHLQRIEIIVKLSGTTKLVLELIKVDYSKAEKHKFYDILCKYSYYIISYYSFMGDKKSLLNENMRYLKYVKYAQKEQTAKYIYNYALVDFSNSSPISSEFLRKIKNSLDEIYEIKLQIDSPEVEFHYYYLAFIYYENNNELDVLLKICDEAEMLINNKPHLTTNTREFAIMFYKLIALLKTKQFEKGILFLNQNLVSIPESNYNWYLLKELEFKLFLQDNKISESYKVYQNVINNKYYKRQVVQLTEKWKIYYAYLVFMDNYLNNGDYKFNLTKFLNDVPVNSKDKSGFNFAIRIIEILFLLAHKKYNIVFAKMDALRIYRSRYLKDNTYKRNHLFLSLLLKAEKTGFDSKSMEKTSWNEIELLKERNNIIADWEIIPYETLWDIFVELSKK